MTSPHTSEPGAEAPGPAVTWCKSCGVPIDPEACATCKPPIRGLVLTTPPADFPELAPLRRIVAALIEALRTGRGIDGVDLETLLLANGILQPVTATEPCSDSCPCSEFGFPKTCLRLTNLGRACKP